MLLPLWRGCSKWVYTSSVPRSRAQKRGSLWPDFQSRLDRLKAKVPVRRLFLKIFMWFWATALGMVLFDWLGSFSGLRGVTSPKMGATVTLISMVLVAGLFSLWLAYNIARPIHSIQSTARRVATGDLRARVPALVSRRHDELAALALDFDSMVDRLEALIQAQKDLLSSVSHEVRSPLARINVCLAILKDEWAGGSADVFDRLESDVERVDLLMGQLLMLSRLEAGLSSADREDVNFGQILEEVTAEGDFEARSMTKSVTLNAKGSVYLDDADPHALRSAFENIIRNAIRFTQPGTNVEVALSIEEQMPRSFVLVSVRDHGPGVPEESLQAIFQPFVQLISDEQLGKTHNGLGLAIASQAVRMHRGTIAAMNLPQGGLEISVRLPVAHYESSDQIEPHNPYIT
jgi:two-component system, OmpR family, sensor histidine kinase CpxA